MNKLHINTKQYSRNFFFVIFLISAVFATPRILFAQSSRMPGLQPTTCTLKRITNQGTTANRKTKTSELKMNSLGYFNRISNIRPFEKLPVEISYPEGSPGDQVLVTVEDGGKLENGTGIQVLRLNSQKKVAFI